MVQFCVFSKADACIRPPLRALESLADIVINIINIIALPLLRPNAHILRLPFEL